MTAKDCFRDLLKTPLERPENHQKTAQRAALVNLTDLLIDWIDNLGSNITKEEKFVKGQNNLGVDLPGVEPGRFGLSIQSSKPAKPTPDLLSQTKIANTR